MHQIRFTYLSPLVNALHAWYKYNAVQDKVFFPRKNSLKLTTHETQRDSELNVENLSSTKQSILVTMRFAWRSHFARDIYTANRL